MSHDAVLQKVYVCTSDAVQQGYCSSQELGRFIVDLPPGKPLNSTSIWTIPINLGDHSQADQPESSTTTTSGLWNNPSGNPIIPDDPTNNTSPFRRLELAHHVTRQDIGQDAVLYHVPLSYPVNRTGYYCAGNDQFDVTSLPKPK
jgi:hypothetical protein